MDRENEFVQYLESFEHTGIYIIDRKNYEVLYENKTARKYTKKDRIGQPCYLVHGNQSMCASCPLRRADRRTLVNREDFGMVFSVRASDTIWMGRETYTIMVQKERDIRERKTLSEESLDRMNRALHSSIISYVDVNMATKMCQAIHFAEDGNHDIFNMPYENYIKDICCKRYIHEEDRTRGEEVLGFSHLNELSMDSEGASELSVRFRIQGAGGKEQVLESTAYILRDELPHHVSIVGKEVTKEEQGRIQLSLYNKLVNSSVATFQINLTRNTFANVAGGAEYTDRVRKNLAECRDLDEFYQLVVYYTVGEEEKKKASHFFDRQEQLAMFEQGKTIIRQRFPIDMDNGTYRWLDVGCNMLKSPLTHDVEAILYCEAVDDNVIGENMINQMISNDYDYLALFDLIEHSNTVYTMKECYEKKEMERNLSVERQKEYLRSIYVGDDVELFLYHNSIGYIHEKLAQKEKFENFYYMREKDGSISYKKETFSYLNGDKRYLLLSRTDNTEAVKRQEEVNRLLQEALERAEKAGRERTELFARMSHDMRTPMNGILGMTDLSKKETDLAVLRRNMELIDSSGRYMLRLINDTLDMKRIETGNLILNPQIQSIRQFVEDLEEMVRPSIQEAKIDFKVIDQNVDMDGYGRFDGIRLKQIFTNLLSNAIKFTPEGGCIEFEIKCLSVKDGKHYDRFLIRDTGIGMGEEFLKHDIFVPYAQENNELTGKYAGPGLGLAITKSLVELMGGTIEVESEKGEGTCFIVSLAIEMVTKEEAEKKDQEKIQSFDFARQKLNHKRILLCEDHPLNAEISQKLLEKVGCEVVWAEDGKKGLELFKNSDVYTFDAILMDIRMPNMDGIQTARAIRVLSRADAKTIPIIAMTANAFQEDMEESRRAGMNEHLAKPVMPGVLYETLERFLS